MPSITSPLSLRGLTLKNRLVVSPMCMYSARDGLADDFHLVHLGRFALGGAGLVFVEATAVSQIGRITPGCLGLWHDDQVPPLQRVVDFLHRFGCAAAIQLNHSGRKGSSEAPWKGAGALSHSATDAALAWPTVAPTAEPGGRQWPAPREMTAEDIDVVVGEFAAAAQRAADAGFDAVEIHCAHGYLLHQFLSPLSNTRSDAFGGTLSRRMSVPLRVAEAVRRVWPEDRPLFARLSSVDGIDIGWSLDDSITFARELRCRGVDVIDCSSGGMRLPRDKQLLSRDPGFHVPYAARIRQDAEVATVAVGLIRDPKHAQQILAEGSADLVAVAREALFNPNWALHALLAEAGAAAWAQWPQPHGWWLERRAEQQADTFDHLARMTPPRRDAGNATNS